MDRTSGDREKELTGHGGWNEDTKDGGGERNLTLKKKSLKKVKKRLDFYKNYVYIKV